MTSELKATLEHTPTKNATEKIARIQAFATLALVEEVARVADILERNTKQ